MLPKRALQGLPMSVESSYIMPNFASHIVLILLQYSCKYVSAGKFTNVFAALRRNTAFHDKASFKVCVFITFQCGRTQFQQDSPQSSNAVQAVPSCFSVQDSISLFISPFVEHDI